MIRKIQVSLIVVTLVGIAPTAAHAQTTPKIVLEIELASIRTSWLIGSVEFDDLTSDVSASMTLYAGQPVVSDLQTLLPPLTSLDAFRHSIPPRLTAVETALASLSDPLDPPIAAALASEIASTGNATLVFRAQTGDLRLEYESIIEGVPEPCSAAILLGGAVALLPCRRRRSQLPHVR